jgi:hypothetical protein
MNPARVKKAVIERCIEDIQGVPRLVVLLVMMWRMSAPHLQGGSWKLW